MISSTCSSPNGTVRPSTSPFHPSSMPTVSKSYSRQRITTPRIAGFKPGQSPPPVKIPTRIRSLLHLGLDQAVVAILAPVEHVDLLRLLVEEDEEVVIDQLHLHRRFLGGHRLDGEPL